MKWFRYTLRKNRLFILTLLAVNVFHMVEGQQFIYAHQVHQQKEDRLKEISELLDIPVDKLRPDHDSLYDSLQKAFGVEPQDPVKAAGLERLQEVLSRHEATLAASPYRGQMEAVKRESVASRVAGLIRDVEQLTSTSLTPAAQRALLRNLRHVLAGGDFSLPLREGLPAKAGARHAMFQAELAEFFDALRPVVSRFEPLNDADLARQISELRSLPVVAAKRASQSARPEKHQAEKLPLRRLERKAPSREVSDAELHVKHLSVTTPGARRAAAKNAIAPEVAALAASLGNSPARILAWVHDNIANDPKWGTTKSPAGTLWEKSGTSWDQAMLLRDLLAAVGVDSRLEWGEVQIQANHLAGLTGIQDPWRAGNMLATGGVPIVLLTQGSQVVAARMEHVWVKAFLDYIPDRGVQAGEGDTWVRMDSTLKHVEVSEGIRVFDQVPFSLQQYLESGTPASPREAHEEALWTYIQANDIECTTLEQLKRKPAIRGEAFPFVPGTLRGQILRIDGEAVSVPDSFAYQLDVDVREADGASLLSWSTAWPAIYGKRLGIAWPGATPDDQATLDAHGGVFETPPYLVDLSPAVKVDGAQLATGAAVGSAQEVEVWVTVTPPNAAPEIFVHDGHAGEPSALVLDFGGTPPELLARAEADRLAAAGSGDAAVLEDAELRLIGTRYLFDLGADLEDLTAWNWQRLLRLVSEGLISQTGTVTTTSGGTPLTFTRGARFVDFPGFVVGLFQLDDEADGDFDGVKPTMELAGAQGSFLEGAVFGRVINQRGIAAVSALTLAQREGQQLRRVDGTNVGTVLAEVDLGAGVEAEVSAAVSRGQVAFVAEQPIQSGRWQGSGYVLQNPDNGAAAYMLSGGYAGGASLDELLQETSDLLGNEPWLNDSPLGDALRFFLDLFGGPPPGPTTNQGDPINLATGNMWQPELDILVPARGIAVTWQRTYNSRSTASSALGYGWSFNWGEHLETRPGGEVALHEGDGTVHLFTSDGGGGFIAPAGKYLTLSQTATGFTLTDKDDSVRTFDLDGRYLSLADRNGNTVTLGYDTAGNLASITDAAGRVVLTLTTVDGKITRMEDLTGRTVLYGYNGDDLVQVTDVVGGVTGLAYDTEHNLVSYTDALGGVRTWSYDIFDRCVEHVNALGFAERFRYGDRRTVAEDTGGIPRLVEFDAQGRALAQIDALGNRVRSTWDASNNRLGIEDPRGGVQSFTYDDSGNILSESDPAGNTVTYTYAPGLNEPETITDSLGSTTNLYDANGNLSEVRESVDGEELVVTQTYDTHGQLTEIRDYDGIPTSLTWDSATGAVISQTDPLGATTTMTVDALGRVVERTDADGNTGTITWDPRGLATSMVDPFGRMSSVTYDALGRQLTLTGPSCADSDCVRSIEYDALGRTVAQTDALGNVTRTEYDARGHVVRQTDPRGNSTVRSYDALGRLLAVVDAGGEVWTFGYCAEVADFCEMTDPLGQTTRQEHDVMGRVTKRVDALGRETRFVYDARGNRTEVIDAAERSTRYEYDSLDRLTAVVTADGARFEYTHDSRGNVINVRDANGHDWSRAYDALGQVTSISDPLGNTSSYSYDILGNLLSMTNADDEVVEVEWDKARLTRILLPDGSEEVFTYDSDNRLLSETNAEVTLRYEYDAAGRRTEVFDETLGQTLRYGYDPQGFLTHLETPNGTVRYFYDSRGRMVEQVDPLTGTYRFTYDAAGRRSGMTYPNGIEVEYAYDAAGLLTSVLSRNALGEIVDGYSYAYDGVGNPTSKTSLRSNLVETYEYDAVDRLTSWEASNGRFETYVYDLTGNRTSLTSESATRTFTFDAASRLTEELRQFTDGASDTTTYAWNRDGTLQRKTSGSAVTDYTWDARDRLLAVNDTSGLHTYGYDPRGRRVRETQGSEIRRHLWSGKQILNVYDETGVLTDHFTYGPRIDEALGQATADGVHYLHSDALGSITAVSDSEGRLAGQTRYSPYGDVEEETGVGSRFGYTGRDRDSTGLNYYRARYYDSSLGSFLSRDPAGLEPSQPETFNTYGYAFGNPVKYNDPSGERARLPFAFHVFKTAIILVAIFAIGFAIVAILLCITGELGTTGASNCIDWLLNLLRASPIVSGLVALFFSLSGLQDLAQEHNLTPFEEGLLIGVVAVSLVLIMILSATLAGAIVAGLVAVFPALAGVAAFIITALLATLISWAITEAFLWLVRQMYARMRPG